MGKARIQNLLTKYYTEGYQKQEQPAPGIQEDMTPVPDCGEKTYNGSGKLEGRKMLITGGDSGIGHAAAIAYSREGADIAINYLEAEQEDADSLAELLKGEGRNVVLIPGDISEEQTCKDIVKKAFNELGGLDNLTMVAGMQQAVEAIADLETEQIDRTFRTNVYSLYWLSKAALEVMPEGSTIVTTSSIQAYQPSPQLLNYAATKAAIMAFTRALAKQVAEKGIRVNSVAPGPIWTALQISGRQPQDALPKFGQSTPLKRAGQPAELAHVYVFLASEDSSYVTAEVYGVTGGEHIF